MGESMQNWYFEGGGLLMSTEARNAYFTLARALTRASLAKRLSVPLFPKDADSIRDKTIQDYRHELKALGLDDVENWTFGSYESELEKPALRFKDLYSFSALVAHLGRNSAKTSIAGGDRRS